MHQYPLTEEEIDDLEVARFMVALPMEVQRLSNGASSFNFRETNTWYQHSYHTGEFNPTFGSTVGCNLDGVYHRSNRPQSDNPRKRRSLAENNDISAFDAAAIVTKMHEGDNFLDDDKESGHEMAINRDDTNTFHGQMIVDSISERPPKRFSFLSEVSSCQVPSTARLGENTGEQHIFSDFMMQPFPDMNASVMSAACAAVMAKDAEKRYEARLNSYLDTPIHDDVLGFQHGRKFRRRAGFRVPNGQLEAAEMLSERMNFAEVNCATSMIQKHNLRRSSSFTFANLRNDLIGAMIPNKFETNVDRYDPLLFGQYTNSPYLQNPLGTKMQRRAMSLPDRNAIYLASQNYMRENEIFPKGMGSNVVANFANIVEQHYGHPFGPQDHARLGHVTFNGPTDCLPNGLAVESECTHDSLGNSSLGAFSSASVPFAPFLSFSPRQDALVASIHANQVLSDMVSHEQQTNRTSTLCNLHVGQQLNSAPYHMFSNVQMQPPTMHYLEQFHNDEQFCNAEQFYNADDFDGKQSDVFSIPISAANVDDHEIALLLHEACKMDDIPVIGNIMQKFPVSARWSLLENETGDVALHVGKFCKWEFS
mmetsp:Transcript_2925/g.5477  ORF Transcript_2925/g.5477 Transcript_2925/m.5477 type:complete len:593 (+) Transcript_2925:175-1953(+)